MSTLILVLSSPTALSPETWQSHLDTIVPLLSHSLPSLAPALTTHRYLDTTPSSSHKWLEATLHSSTPVPAPERQAALSALTRSPSPLSLSANLYPLLPIHKSFPSRPAGPRLAVFDMDSTLIRQEVIDELARTVGRYDAVAAITDAAMRGDTQYADFAASLRARVALLGGVEGGVWDTLKRETIAFTLGARELVRCLKRDGWTTAVLSGGFVTLAEWVKAELGLDYAFANRLETDAEGRLTGRLEEGAEIVDGAKKRELLIRLAGQHGVARDATVAVGDGSNDLLMMGEAALGVAFNAKPKVQEKAPAVVNGESLVDVLHVLGWTQEEIKAVMGQ